MSHYVKLVDDPTFWFVEDGKRTLVESPDHMRQFGLWPIVRVTLEELEAIPFSDAPDPEPEPEIEEEPLEDEC